MGPGARAPTAVGLNGVNSIGAIDNLDQLEDVLSRVSERTRRVVAELDGDIVVLGAAGKMGPTLCRLLKAAGPEKMVYAVSRFSDPTVRDRLEQAGVRTVVADLLDRAAYDTLPDVANVYYLAGMKFGAGSNQSLTWAMNAYVPALVCERYRGRRIVAFSTGNVYPFVNVASGGATERTPPDPIGEYAQSCLARERIFQYFSGNNNTPVVLIRLNYANEPRYGIIVDLARKILADEPIDLTTGFVNVIWQGDANDYIASAMTLASTPAAVLNIAGPETVSVRYLTEQIGLVLNHEPTFVGVEASTALLSNAGKCFETFGYPRTSLLTMLRTIAVWVAADKPTLKKPTKFQIRDGVF